MKKILLLCSLVFVLGSLQAQQRSVSGKITSAEDGSALPGVNVLLKGTATGSVTDADGNYNLSVPSSGGILVFSFIGLQSQEIEIGQRSVIDLSLSLDVKSLSEVIVTAQGIIKTKNELSYAAQTVGGDALSSNRDNNLMNSLSGKVSGVQITKNNSMGGSTNVIIRGYKSLTGNNQALFVVDGVPVDNGTYNDSGTGRGTAGYDYGNVGADVNPDDIESTTILKGPAATALYGSRASNGVVYITTKKGRKKGVGVTINTGLTVGTVDKTTFPTYQKQYGAGYGKYYGPTEDGYFDLTDVDGDGNLDNITPTYEDASVGAAFDPNTMVYQWDSYGDPTSPNYQKKTPWLAAPSTPVDYFRTGLTYNNSVVIDGGSEKGNFKLGYTRTNEKGVQPNSSLDKNYLNFSASYEVVKNLTATASINFTQQHGIGRYATGYGGNNNISSFREWWQTNVDINAQKAAYDRTGENITWNWGGGFPGRLGTIYWDNPFFAANKNYSEDSRTRYLGYVKLDYKITDWLNVMGRISLDSYSQLQEERTAVGSVNYPPGDYTRRDRNYQEYNYDFLATAKKNLTPDISFNASLGSNIRRTTVTGISAVTNGGLTVPGIYALSNSINQIEAPSELFSDIQVNGVFADAGIGYKEFIFLNGSFRRDASSTLPKGNNAYNYFSASTSFVFTEFIAENPILTFGKFRVNYAEVGNSAPFNALADQYVKPTAFGTSPLFSLPATKNNSQLLPERTKSFEIGAEFTLFDGRAHFDVNYFKSQSVDQILPVTVSTASGFSSKYVNAGTVENKGWELTLGGTPIKAGAFKWDINVNWTKIHNEVTALYGDVTNLQLNTFRAGGGSSNAPLGMPFGTIYGTDYVYTNGQRTVLSNGRYQRTTTATNPIGNINPDWTGGVQNTFSYKNVSLGFLIDVKHGGDVYSADMYYGLATGLYAETVGINELGNEIRLPVSQGGGILKEGVQSDGSVNTVRLAMDAYPMNGGTVNPNTAYVYDAGYVKLREVVFSYSLPTSIVSKWSGVNSLTFSAVGRNLWIIHKNIPYADPEDNLGAGNIQGYQVGSLPSVRNIGFNIKATF
jgi:TonB-linked SusC/RagA family outer membrane protein